MPLELNEKTLKSLAELAKQRVEGAKSSNIEKIKERKYYKTKNLMELRADRTEYQSRYRFVPPIFLTAVNTWVAATSAAFRQDPVVSIRPKGTTPRETTYAVQKIIDWNIEETKHMHFFNRVTVDAFTSGTGIFKRASQFRMIPTPVPVQGAAGQILTEIYEKMNWNDYSYRVNPLNYIQDTATTGNDFFLDKCKWCGEITTMSRQELFSLKEQTGAIPTALEKLLKQMGKESSPSELSWKANTISDNEIDKKNYAVIYELYGMWNIEGNYEDYAYYKLLFSEDTTEVVYIERVIDHPYTLIRPLYKNDNYCGWSPCEAIIPINVIQTKMLGQGIENIMSNLKRLVFYATDSGIKKSDLTDPANNGYVGVDFRAGGYQQISQIIQEFQGRDINVQSMQAYLALFNDIVQRATNQSDLYTFGIKPSVGGGLSNAGYTATGANIVNQNTKTPIAFILNNIANDHAAHFDKKLLAIQSDMPDFQMVEIADYDSMLIRKATTLGNFKADIISGLIVNKVNTLQDIVNIFPFLSNIMATAANIGQTTNINLTAFLREVAELANLPNKNEIFPKELPQQLTPAQPNPEPAAAAA